MSTETTPDQLRRYEAEEGRFQRRIYPPDPLHDSPHVNYPARDGRLMSDNTLQAEWINRITGGLETLYRDDPAVFVASNLMWYPIKGNNRRRLAPDVMVVFGRPKRYRKSYIQHRERGIAPQVAFEILSPGNRKRVMDFKRTRYEAWGVEEYYVFDPYKIALEIWLSDEGEFHRVPESSGFVSPRMGIRFELDENLTIYAPDGRPFLDYAEVARERDEFQAEVEQAEHRADQADRRAEAERDRAEAERDRANRLAARLRELGLEPDE